MRRGTPYKSPLKGLEDSNQTFISGNSFCTWFVTVYKVGFINAC